MIRPVSISDVGSNSRHRVAAFLYLNYTLFFSFSDLLATVLFLHLDISSDNPCKYSRALVARIPLDP